MASSLPLKSAKTIDKELNSATFSVLLLELQVNVFKPTPIELYFASKAVSDRLKLFALKLLQKIFSATL